MSGLGGQEFPQIVDTRYHRKNGSQQRRKAPITRPRVTKALCSFRQFADLTARLSAAKLPDLALVDALLLVVMIEVATRSRDQTEPSLGLDDEPDDLTGLGFGLSFSVFCPSAAEFRLAVVPSGFFLGKDDEEVEARLPPPVKFGCCPVLSPSFDEPIMILRE